MAESGTLAIMFGVILFSDITVLRSKNYSAVLRALNDTYIQITSRFERDCGAFP